MTAQPDGGDRFEAGHDNRGAFATGAGASARNVEAGGVYNEIYYGNAPRSARLQSLLPEDYQSVVINGCVYEIHVEDAVLIDIRYDSKPKKQPDGSIEI